MAMIKLKVMSRNIYLGADIFPVIAVAEQQAQLPPEQQNPIAIPLAVAEVFQTVQATNFPERAQALADEIERRRTTRDWFTRSFKMVNGSSRLTCWWHDSSNRCSLRLLRNFDGKPCCTWTRLRCSG